MVSAEYCKASDFPELSKPGVEMGVNGRVADRLTQKMGILGDLIYSCTNAAPECGDKKLDIKKKLEFARGMKEVCAQKDPGVCKLVTETKAFCSKNPDFCNFGSDSVKMDQRNITEDITQDYGAKRVMDLVAVCRTDANACGQQKAEIRKKLDLMMEVKAECAKSPTACEQARELAAVCDVDAIKCQRIKELKILCAENPQECERQKDLDRKADLEKMKTRCEKTPDVCKRNVMLKRNYCNNKSNTCDKETLDMLDEMEKFISQVGK